MVPAVASQSGAVKHHVICIVYGCAAAPLAHAICPWYLHTVHVRRLNTFKDYWKYLLEIYIQYSKTHGEFLPSYKPRTTSAVDACNHAWIYGFPALELAKT